ncbi:MAG: argininosuccinate lyase [Cyanobium sp. LacPavin_0818_WC50_MAG_67_9]|nr:argininosuccinate lyase [Cyanobium sp. LacPavin_0818_WC50_MAG_67_9]
MAVDSTASTWSQRFEQGLHPAIERFNASIGFDIALLQQDLDGSIAHARMLGRCGVISEAEAAELIEGLETVRAEAARGAFNPGLEAEDVHFAVERRLIELLGPLGKKLHTGRSRNDQVGTDLRLWLRGQIGAIDGALLRFERALLAQAERHSTVLIPGYTHLQRLADVRRRVNICPLGAAALAGTPVPIDRRQTAAELGFEALYANSLDAVSDRDFAVEFMAAASLVLVHLSRLSEEVILWASEEFGFVGLTDRCATGSSLMPQKKNPDVPELVRGKSGRVFGHLMGLLTMIKGLPLAYNKDFQEDKEALFDGVRTCLDCLEAMAILFEEGLEFRPQRLEAAVAADFSNATDVADYLVAKGVPFREAYQLVGGLVKGCLAEGVLLVNLPLERWQQLHPAFEADIYAAISPRQVVAARRSEGGTGFEQVEQQLQRIRMQLAT